MLKSWDCVSDVFHLLGLVGIISLFSRRVCQNWGNPPIPCKSLIFSTKSKFEGQTFSDSPHGLYRLYLEYIFVPGTPNSNLFYGCLVKQPFSM